MERIIWSKLDLEELERRYYAGREAAEKVAKLEKQMNACYDRTCNHPPFKKDGTPDKRYDCEPVPAESLYDELRHLSDDLYFTHHITFFKAIGLPLSDEDD